MFKYDITLSDNPDSLLNIRDYFGSRNARMYYICIGIYVGVFDLNETYDNMCAIKVRITMTEIAQEI